MATRANGENLRWYRSPVSKADMALLNQRSDLKGWLWTLGYLGLLATTGTAAYLAVGRLHWAAVLGLLYVHGTCWSFLINGFHELIHDSVFKTRKLNEWFLWIFGFLGMHSHVWFWASHTEHHKFTLHPPDDQEVVLPAQLKLKDFLFSAVVNPLGLKWNLKTNLRHARGRLEGDWEHRLFATDAENLRRLVRWARFLLIGHGAIIIGSLCVDRWVLPGHHLWMVPILTTCASFYGNALHWLCNNTQHVGLRANVPDFRLCCRTIRLNPLIRFLYWNMNYHTEHHMFAAVPCYNLGKLHRLISADLPPCPNGLYQSWMEIARIMRRQRAEPGYVFTAPVPTNPPVETLATASSATNPSSDPASPRSNDTRPTLEPEKHIVAS